MTTNTCADLIAYLKKRGHAPGDPNDPFALIQPAPVATRQ